ncbi:MAG TPA: Fe-Mn family superoxide dismutase [Burkholderiales bacterium]|nr:Fe-Mn family superoxide dismutase [Burkholderiales bacterium]
MPHQVRQFDLDRVRAIWGRTFEVHLGLYAGYVEQLNKLTSSGETGSAARAAEPETWARRFAFEHNGVVLHESFFEALSGPATSLARDGALARALTHSFGSDSAWRADVRELASIRGIGWIALIRSPATARLHNVWIDEHQLSVPAASDVLMLLDLWEHAWLFDYAPKDRARFASDLVEQLNWSVIERRFAETR